MAASAGLAIDSFTKMSIKQELEDTREPMGSSMVRLAKAACEGLASVATSYPER